MMVFLLGCAPELQLQEDSFDVENAYEVVEQEEESRTEEDEATQDSPTLEEDIFDPIQVAGEPVALASGFWFAEGPLWRDNGSLLLSDIPASLMYRYVDGVLDVFQYDSGESNGLFAHQDGGVLVAQHRERRIALLEQGQVKTVVDSFEGRRFHSPNDLTMSSEGYLYFTDPPFGLTGQPELDFNGVYQLSPQGDLSVIWAGASHTRPNGIVLSPDEKTLYVSYTYEAVVRSFAIDNYGKVVENGVFAYVGAIADGMSVDRQGNLYVATSQGIEVIDPLGDHWGTIALPKQPSNCTFGGQEGNILFVTAQDSLYQISFDF